MVKMAMIEKYLTRKLGLSKDFCSNNLSKSDIQKIKKCKI